MTNVRSKNHPVARFLRRVLAGAAACALALVFAPSAQAEGEPYSLGDCSDDVLRAETRLNDLGYLTGVVDGLWEEEDASAFAAFAAASALESSAALDALFSKEAVPLVAAAASVFSQGNAGFLMAQGSLMPWDEVKTRLKPGESYGVTGCYSGITLRMNCVSLGTYARFQPTLDWDDATLRGFFPVESSSEKQPVVVTMDGVLVAASVQFAAAQLDGSLPVYNVYFHNSVSQINGIPDAEHEAVVLAAAGSAAAD